MAICMKHYIGVLVEKSLIKIYLDGKMTLHDLIEDVSKEIVRKKIIKRSCELSQVMIS